MAGCGSYQMPGFRIVTEIILKSLDMPLSVFFPRLSAMPIKAYGRFSHTYKIGLDFIIYFLVGFLYRFDMARHGLELCFTLIEDLLLVFSITCKIVMAWHDSMAWHMLYIKANDTLSENQQK